MTQVGFGVRTGRRLLFPRLAVAAAIAAIGGGAFGFASVLWGRQQPSPYANGVWMAGDHHIHTRYSGDGQYQIEQQVAHAAAHGLHWCVITDHGSRRHEKVALDQAYPDLVAARRKHPEIIVFQGLEWNIPAAEHGSVILPISDDEARRISEFEARYDERNESLPDTPANTEADAVAGVKYLQGLSPKPLFIANHPARRGLDSPHEMRAWSDAGPDVTRGFEGAPGHQAAALNGGARGGYGSDPAPASFSGYPTASYRTWGGYDWYVSQVGGLWDSLLGEGRSWYITANSDSHRHFTDRTIVDASTLAEKGYVTPTDKKADKNDNEDYYPGEYSKTWVFASRREPGAVLEAIRSGNMFTVLGDLIDRCELYALSGDRTASMGGTLSLDRAGQEVNIRLRVRVPSRANFGGKRPTLHHIDIITGDIRGTASDRDAMTNPGTRVVATLRASEAKRDGEFLEFTHRIPDVRQDFFVRVRGTNTDVDAPRQDVGAADPWGDLWFYSNPVRVRLPQSGRS
ncbi:MAG: PHP domain-containing protein [Capsulimonadales bacterium]|nr:PHP domain-containing protein [Capsulimonadales bacterium]